ncbi:glycerophosphoryl diester phosphodiesterase [Vibrio ishigakensis]|uniref:Glycerophosphoryl diester phosphodiesterase n=1 Tax=Vibrio ishigakensis TaxID=1481914 RepID=A0A0B8QBJ5_9VIBR|nr:glycerophosphoryl diester phosphodiesterase [Vibrio sp. JCM 19236]GAM76041.1 glycerophosphoryl diester phosphodiesterase [Vibrio ishigakensis]
MHTVLKTTAHRGLSSQAPENTMAAFKLAVEQGCDWIEIDVQLSADGIPMVIHDQTVNRCTNGSGKVAEMSLSQLEMLDAGLWFGEEYREEPIPTLLDTLSYVKNANVSLNIELKVYPQDDIHTLCQRVKEVIVQTGVSSEQILFSSFETKALLKMKQLLPEVRRGQLWQSIPNDAMQILQQLSAYSVHCDYRFLTESVARNIKQNGYQLYCYTPNFPELVNEHWKWG